MYEHNLNEIRDSVGVICGECNQKAYYFNTRNRDFFSEKHCLICSKDKCNGILLEDFVFTLTRKLKNHYKLIKDEMSEAISLNQVLKRFTYDNEQVLKKLAHLLCQENGSYFQLEGRYISIVDDVFKEECEKESIEQWNNFSRELKHIRRFTHTGASRFYEDLIGACMYSVEKNEEFNSALKTIKKGNIFYRGRLAKDDSHKRAISSNPEVELGAPPDFLAANNRMSPSGISFMYTASDPQTAIAELRPYVNDTIAIGEFVSTKDLNFFDFTLLDKMLPKDANILDDPINDKSFQNRYLLGSIHELISRPFRATDISYIETQMFAETIRNYKNGFFHGIIFGSSQRDGGLNYVLFGDISKDENCDEVNKDYHVELDRDLGVKFYKVVKMTASTEELD
ncbi:RES family NAD+ phosphorylase [Vibrio gazogenes]|nr:RES family NAD+ phosphorylase [Vibrio gazogenes]USP13305.1 RES family NAD+ phosphorylase [Vibrio gazogenes]